MKYSQAYLNKMMAEEKQPSMHIIMQLAYLEGQLDGSQGFYGESDWDTYTCIHKDTDIRATVTKKHKDPNRPTHLEDIQRARFEMKNILFNKIVDDEEE